MCILGKLTITYCVNFVCKYELCIKIDCNILINIFKLYNYKYIFFFSEVLPIEGHQDQGRKRAAKQRTPKKIQQYPVNDA